MDVLIKKAPEPDKWELSFKEINLEWLSAYFSVTPADLDQLENPHRIIDEGGTILFILVDGIAVGTLALVCKTDGSMELAKMGVLSGFRGKGLGRRLISEAIEIANASCAKGLYLDTVEVLKPAITLYESVGFIRVGEPVVHPLFGRTTFRMELQKS